MVSIQNQQSDSKYAGVELLQCNPGGGFLCRLPGKEIEKQF